MKKRIAVLGTFLESNRYSPIVGAHRFRCLYGIDILDDAKSESPKMLKEGLGFFSSMDDAGGWEPVPISLVLGGAGGPAEAVFMERQFIEIRKRLESEKDLDGVYILNHGAMTTTTDDDPDGTLYALVREAVGATVPIVATVDLHANISQQMVDAASVIVSYRTDPHVDQYECGVEAAKILLTIIGGKRPVVRNIRVPIVPPNVSLLTDDGPYGDLIDFGQSKMSADVANVSVVAGFAFGDTSANGLHVIVTTWDNKDLASSLCTEIAQRAWDSRERFMWNLTPQDIAVQMAVRTGSDKSMPPLLLADLGDNIGAGGPGSTLCLLQAIISANAKGVFFGSLHDPAAVQRAIEAGEGELVDIQFQGDDWGGTPNQLIVEAMRVESLHSGRFRITEGPLVGMAVNSGDICLLKKEHIWVLVTSHRPLVWPDPKFLVDLGVDIDEIRTLILKCRSSYRAVYQKYFQRERMVEVDTSGRTSPVLTRHNWERIPRPSFPIDQNFHWVPPKLPT